jgi:hypothetical protein
VRLGGVARFFFAPWDSNERNAMDAVGVMFDIAHLSSGSEEKDGPILMYKKRQTRVGASRNDARFTWQYLENFDHDLFAVPQRAGTSIKARGDD